MLHMYTCRLRYMPVHHMYRTYLIIVEMYQCHYVLLVIWVIINMFMYGVRLQFVSLCFKKKKKKKKKSPKLEKERMRVQPM